MNGVTDLDLDEFVEVDPTGRYGRYNEILGKGASKTVYRAFDEYEGIEVAWNQVKIYDFLQSPEDLERLYCEIHLLKTLKHGNIMKFYTSWVDIANRNINFVTEMFTSGTLRQYRLRHKKINTRAIKHWCRQILQGLLYLHSHDPPIIHRDLKCDNIFINGNQGEVKIGDLGLAAMLRKSHAACCVGTPEFMAPEVYKEEYNELVDIYSFGMCILEMVTFEYPYSECTHPAQIYKKVISGKKPDALYKVKDPEIRAFVEKCLATVSDRQSAWELLNDPFLQIDDYVKDLRPLSYYDQTGSILRQPLLSARCSNHSSLVNGSNYIGYEQEHDLDCNSSEYETNEFELFTSHEDDHLEDVDITIKGRRNGDGNIFLRLRIAEKEGLFRNIYFPFDVELDTALTVATEMVSELDITDQDVTKIAEMIDREIASLVPEWKTGCDIEEPPNHGSSSFTQNSSSEGSIAEHLASHVSGKILQVLQSPRHEGGTIHGRFEEITYKLEDSESDGIKHTDTDLSNEHEHSCESKKENDVSIERNDTENASFAQDLATTNHSALNEDYENEKRQGLRWLKAKYQKQLRKLRDRKLGTVSKSPKLKSCHNNNNNNDSIPFASCSTKGEKDEVGKQFIADPAIEPEKDSTNQTVYKFESKYNSCSPVHMFTANSFYASAVFPHLLLDRATSIPVDETDL